MKANVAVYNCWATVTFTQLPSWLYKLRICQYVYSQVAKKNNDCRFKWSIIVFCLLYTDCFLLIARSTVTRNGRPTAPWRFQSQEDRGPALCTAPASECLSLPWRASRPAITWASSSTDPSPPTGCFLTAWRTGKVRDTFWRQGLKHKNCYQSAHMSLCALTQAARTASTSPRWRRVQRWAATSACRSRSWAESTPRHYGSPPAACSVTPTCVCTTALSSACTSDVDTHTHTDLSLEQDTTDTNILSSGSPSYLAVR